LCANSDFSPIKPDFSQCSSRRQNDFLVPKFPGAFLPRFCTLFGRLRSYRRTWPNVCI
jgi:hypothetical protein